MKELNRRPLIYKIPTFTQVLLTVLEYLWALAVVLNGNTVFHASGIKAYHLLEWCVFLTVLLLVTVMYVYRIRPAWDQLLLAVGLMIYAVVYLGTRQSQMAVMDFVLLFVVGAPTLFLLFTILHSRGRLLRLIRRLFDVVVVLAVISLYYWTFGVMLRIIPVNCYTTIKWGYLSQIMGYDGIHYVTQLDTTFFPDAYIFRNSGIFAEAPMFNLWLDLALAGELFLKPCPSKCRVVVLVITILTTLSVTGILFIVLCVVIHVLQNYHKMDRRQKMFVVAAGTFLLPMVVIMAAYSLTLKADTESYSMRLSDYVAGIMLWWDHPLFGGGYGNLQMLMQYTYSPNGVMGFSNSLTAVLGTGGLWMAVLFYIPQICMLFPRVTKDPKLTCFGICYLFLFCTTLFFARYIGVVLVAFTMAVTFNNRKNVT